MTATFTGPGGADPVAAIRALRVSAQPTEGDVLYALQRERTRILKRTASGVDANGAAFRPYSAAYAKRKSKYRSTSTVDLRGRNAPHMLQAIVATVGSLTDEGDSLEPANDAVLAFYDDRAALLARVHNEGEGRMPKREFFTATDQDLADMENDIGARIEIRLRNRAA
jgi:hypothetical protein